MLQHLVFVVCLNQLQSICSILWKRDNLINIQLCNHQIFNWLIKEFSSIDHNIIIFFFHSWKIILLVTFSIIIIFKWQNNKSTYSLKTWTMRKSKYLFRAWFVVLGRYLFQSIVLLKPDSNCLRSFMFSWIDKVTTGTFNLYQLFEILDFDLLQYQLLEYNF